MKEILNIAVIGASKMAMKHMDGVVANKGAKLYAICDKYIDKAKDAAEKYGVDMPITEEANKILFEGKNPKDAVYDLMNRDRKSE